MAKFKDLDQIESELAEAQNAYDEAMVLTKERDAIQLALTALLQVKNEIAALPDPAFVLEAMTLLRELELLGRDTRILAGAVSDLAQAELEMADVPNADDVLAAIKIIDKLAKVQVERDKLNSAVSGLINLGNAKEEYDVKANELKQRLFSAMDGVACPTCGRMFDVRAKRYIMEE